MSLNEPNEKPTRFSGSAFFVWISKIRGYKLERLNSG